jgi:hypothetical protein
MKSLIFAATLILSASAFAKSDYRPITDYDGALHEINLKNACVTSDEVRTINPQTVCTELEPHTTVGNGEMGTVTEWECVNWETKQLAYSRAFTRTVCLKNAPVNEAHSGECLKWGTREDFLPATIKYRTEILHGEVIREFSGKHTFPACN